MGVYPDDADRLAAGDTGNSADGNRVIAAEENRYAFLLQSLLSRLAGRLANLDN